MISNAQLTTAFHGQKRRRGDRACKRALTSSAARASEAARRLLFSAARAAASAAASASCTVSQAASALPLSGLQPQTGECPDRCLDRKACVPLEMRRGGGEEEDKEARAPASWPAPLHRASAPAAAALHRPATPGRCAAPCCTESWALRRLAPCRRCPRARHRCRHRAPAAPDAVRAATSALAAQPPPCSKTGGEKPEGADLRSTRTETRTAASAARRRSSAAARSNSLRASSLLRRCKAKHMDESP